MIQLLHISDIHLNSGYASKNDSVRNSLRQGLNDSVKNAVNYTIHNNIEGIIIAGDFFDHDKISFKDEHFVLENFKSILQNNQKIFYVTGNHDPMRTAKFLEILKRHPNFFLIEEDEIKVLELTSKEQENYKVVAVGHKSKNEQRNLIKNFPIKDTGDIWIGIGHASVPSALSTPDKESYMATALSQIEILNYNYFALGHIHIRQLLTPKIAYSGNIQGLNIKETGAKGGYLISLTANETRVEKVDFNTIDWEQIEIILTPKINSLQDLQTFLIEEVMACISQIKFAAKQIIIRINLGGRTPLKFQLEESSNLDFITEIIKDKTGVLDLEIKLDKVYNHYDIEELSRENTVLSQMINRIATDAYEHELLDRIFELPIFSQKSASEDKLQMIIKIKEELLQEVIDRMVVRKDDN